MIINLPEVTEIYDAERTRIAYTAIRRALNPLAGSEEAVQSVLLRAPGGSVWRVSADDTGALTTTRVQG
jgi:hypothetical protein